MPTANGSLEKFECHCQRRVGRPTLRFGVARPCQSLRARMFLRKLRAFSERCPKRQARTISIVSRSFPRALASASGRRAVLRPFARWPAVSHHRQLAVSLRDEARSFIFSRNGLQNHEKCGFAATRSCENSQIFSIKLCLLSTSRVNLFSVLKFELIRT